LPRRSEIERSNWRQDLNYSSHCGDDVYVILLEKQHNRDLQFEADGRSANLDTTIEKPFGVFT
jgi:hypothetical protein